MSEFEWQPMGTAPVNPAGQAFGPTVLVWCRANNLPWPAYYNPHYIWDFADPGPAWVVPDSDEAITPDDAGGWMPLPEPPKENKDD